ncbi:LOW QUALITY PROTEIN: thiamine-triphosphatase [Heterodontus francisci]|uniref:LOW QUALITY PROTEIN: thiamine-triphosphatase n=1 Tax=Heterodontus francisci TaxID=7792 RepID=UPI00355B78BE
MPVEVEQKFCVREDTEARIRALGGVCGGTAHIEDRYYDTGDHLLTSADLWLRRRDGHWQLKSPAAGSRGRTGIATQYRETESESEIVSFSAPCPPAASGLMVNQLVGVAPLLQEFAVIVTERRVYELAGGLRVDLDWADFGHSLGEIEVMVDSEEEIPAALAKIQDLARKLELEDGERQPGKMHAYLQRYRPCHLQRLLEAHVL